MDRMDWKSADFHDGWVIFGGVGGKKHPFVCIFNPFSYIELPKMFQINFFFFEYVPFNLFHHT
jgi:hypothetical protein